MGSMPRNPGEVTYEWLRDALREPFPENELVEMNVDASVGDLGYLGSICRVRLSFGDAARALPDSLILKFPSENDEVLANGVQLGAYRKEADFYRNLANRGAGRAPRHYFSVPDDETGEFMVAIEDLGDLRFVKQTEGASFEDSASVMRSLAHMHADYWQHEDLEAPWLGTIANWGPANAPLIEAGLPLYRQNFGHIIDYPPFIELWDRGAAAYGRVCAHLAGGTCTLMHGDAHIRNLAFEDQHENPVRFYDWQLSCKGPAAYDVLYFFVNSLPVVDQEMHLDKLLSIYQETLTGRGISYDMEDLLRDMAYSSLTFWGFIAWLGNILPPNEATIELVSESTPRYMYLMKRLDSVRLIHEFD